MSDLFSLTTLLILVVKPLILFGGIALIAVLFRSYTSARLRATLYATGFAGLLVLPIGLLGLGLLPLIPTLEPATVAEASMTPEASGESAEGILKPQTLALPHRAIRLTGARTIPSPNGSSSHRPDGRPSMAVETVEVPLASSAFPLVPPEIPPLNQAPSLERDPFLLHALQLLWFVWGIGALSFLIAIFRVHNRHRPKRFVPLAADHHIPRKIQSLGLETPCPVYLSIESACPQVCGIFSPKIILPKEAAQWPPEVLYQVIEHEAAHVRAHDPLMRMVATLASALLWFHPVVWFARKALVCQQELACDDQVIASGADAVSYAELLLQLCAPEDSPFFPSPAMARRSGLGQRIERLLSPSPRPLNARSWSLWLTVASVGLFAGLIGVVTTAKPSPPQKTNKESNHPTNEMIAQAKPSKPKIHWEISLNEAFKKAAAEKKLVLALFANGSETYKRMERLWFNDAKVLETSKAFICVKVDAHKTPEIGKTYKVMRLPTILVMDANGLNVHRFSGRKNGPLPPEEFASNLESALKRQAAFTNGNPIQEPKGPEHIIESGTTKTIPLPTGIIRSGIAVHGDHAWFIHNGMHKMNLKTGDVGKLPGTPEGYDTPRALAHDGTHLYCIDWCGTRDGNFAIADPDTGKLLDRMFVDYRALNGGCGCFGGVATEDSLIFLSTGTSPTLLEIDKETGLFKRKINVQSNWLYGLARQGDHLLSYDVPEKAIIKIDPDTGSIVEKIPTQRDLWNLSTWNDKLILLPKEEKAFDRNHQEFTTWPTKPMIQIWDPQ